MQRGETSRSILGMTKLEGNDHNNGSKGGQGRQETSLAASHAFKATFAMLGIPSDQSSYHYRVQRNG